MLWMSGPPTRPWIRQAGAALLLLALFGLLASVTTSARLEPADFVMNNGSEVSTLDPANVSGVPEGRVMYALYEGLTVKHPETLEPVPGMAERWELSEDGRTYTFHIRPEASWSNGDALTAHDFEWSWRRLLSPETASEYVYQLWYVKNARDFTLLEGEQRPDWSEVGIKATDERTLVVELASPTPFFLHLVSFYCTFPVHRPTVEWAQENHPDTWQIEWVRPENIVTNGPYVIQERRINDRIRVRKNPLYWDADNVAMNTIDILAVESYGTMLNLYLTGEVDWIDKCVPNLAPRLLEREDFNPRPYLGTYFYRVNVTRPPFNDLRVRRALALAIDRRAICRDVMKKGEVPNYSLCPDGMPGYPRPEMRHTPLEPDLSNYDEAFAADCEEARQLLAEAGFGPAGESMPTILLHYNTAEAHRDVAEVMADTWARELGVTARLQNEEWKVYLDTQNTINYDVSRSAWIGDYPDPNTFVDLFVTGGENNRTGWGNARFDELVEGAAREVDPTERLRMLAEAESILLEELPVLPIYNYVSQNLVNPRLGGFFENLQDDHYPKFFYWMNDEELAARRASQPASWEITFAPGPSEGLYAPNAAGRAGEPDPTRSR